MEWLSPPRALPGAPLFERLVLESPLPLIAGLLAAGLVALALLRRAGRTKAGLAALGAAAVLAGAAWVAASAVTTTRERLQQRSRAFIDAVAAADTGAVGAMLAPEARMYWFEAPSGMGLDRILAGVEEYLGRRYRVGSHRIGQVQATVDGPGLGRTQAQVTVEPEADGRPYPTWWRLDWRLEGDEWLVVGIEPLKLPGIAEPGGR